MKILEVIFNLSPGGAERFVVDLSNELAMTDEVILLAINKDIIDVENRNFYKFDLSPKVEYRCLQQPNGISLKKSWTIYKAFKAINPDVIHLHGCPMPYFCILAIVLLCRRIKFFQTIHSDLNNGYVNWFYKLLFGVLSRTGLYGIIALSEQNNEQVKRTYPNAKSACIPNGRSPICRTSEFDKVKDEMLMYKLNEDSLIFIHVARFNPQKNQMLLIKSFNKFIERGANADLVCIGVGYDSEEGRALQAQACRRVHFIGPRKNISDYMLASNIFCLSSDYEGLPITLIEASMAGLPSISTPVGGVHGIIKNEINGIISNDHSEKSYIQSLFYAYNNYKRLKINADKMKEKNMYTINKCAQSYRAFFEN